jgi:uncharacterized protein YktA (UPF0223 family)
VLSKIAAKEKLTDEEIMHTYATFSQVLISVLEEKQKVRDYLPTNYD